MNIKYKHLTHSIVPIFGSLAGLLAIFFVFNLSSVEAVSSTGWDSGVAPTFEVLDSSVVPPSLNDCTKQTVNVPGVLSQPVEVCVYQALDYQYAFLSGWYEGVHKQEFLIRFPGDRNMYPVSGLYPVNRLVRMPGTNDVMLRMFAGGSWNY